MRTLIVSDLHVGAGRGRPVLDDPSARQVLAAAIASSDRLVLLGDIVELREGPVGDALAAASRVLPELVAGMSDGREVILIAGNHDHQLIAPSLSRRNADPAAGPLAVDEELAWRDGEPLGEVVAMLGSSGAKVSVRYPGVWLRHDVFAHHGHYLDRHTTTPAFERLAAEGMARMLNVPLSAIGRVEDYERVLAPIYAWMFAIAQAGDGEVDASETGASTRVLKWVRAARGPGAYALEVGLRGVAAAINATGLGPLSGDLSGGQLRRSALSAYGEVLAKLDVDPVYALFGHSHRAGPLPATAAADADDRSEWSSPAGVRLLNSGSWVNEPMFFDAVPYRPGFAIELDDAGPPRLVNLLDEA